MCSQADDPTQHATEADRASRWEEEARLQYAEVERLRAALAASATDVDVSALARAMEGFYGSALGTQVSAARKIAVIYGRLVARAASATDACAIAQESRDAEAFTARPAVPEALDVEPWTAEEERELRERHAKHADEFPVRSLLHRAFATLDRERARPAVPEALDVARRIAREYAARRSEEPT